MKLTISNMSCGGCAGAIARAIASIDAEAKVWPDLANRGITVETTRSEADVRAVLAAAGYPASGPDADAGDGCRS